MAVFGTRPEAIKLAPVIRELQRRGADHGVETVVCVTAQHREMLDQVLALFALRPDYDLAVMEADQTLARGGRGGADPAGAGVWCAAGLGAVQGDTTTVAAAALATFYVGARVGHVEAGLRTDDKWRPFPEEINRRVASVIADLHFAPTERARQNLLQENVPGRGGPAHR